MPMFANFSRRGRVRIVSYALAVLVLSLGTAVSQYRQSLLLERAVANSYRHAFSEVTASLDRMNTALQKGIYVTTSPMLCSLCSEVFAQAMTAQMALGQLPLAHAELEQTAAFVAKVGDWAQALSRAAARDEGAIEREHETWKSLAEAAGTLSGRLDELELELIDGSFAIHDGRTAARRLSAGAGELPGEEGPEGFQAIESEFPELPSLIYDGPFSQHLEGRTPAMLDGEAELTEAEAQEKAMRLMESDAVTLTGQADGTIPSYTFSCETESGTAWLELTRQGGRVLSFLCQSAVSEQNLTVEEGIAAARALLERMGITEVEDTYYQIDSNVLTVNFCAVQDGVRCYADLVKVGVSLADGSPVTYEGRGYLVNHRARELTEPTVSQEEAAARISEELEVQSVALALIPTAGEYEVLCWEFRTQTEEGQQVLVYLNAATGAEERILLLLEDEHGTLTI